MVHGRIIDCCSLINLRTGWGGLSELSEFGWQWYLCEAVLKEAEHTREYGKDGLPVSVPIDLGELTANQALGIVGLRTEEELVDYLEFASEVDDGEAQALAIAKHRGLMLLTDDRKAIRLASRPDVAVATISTVDVLQVWTTLSPENAMRLGEILRRIENLARFSPRKDSPDYLWWDHCREEA